MGMTGKRGWLLVYIIALALQWVGSAYFLVDWMIHYEVDGYFGTGLIQFILLNIVMYFVICTERSLVIPMVVIYELLVIAGQLFMFAGGLNHGGAVAAAVVTSALPIGYFLRSARVKRTYTA